MPKGANSASPKTPTIPPPPPQRAFGQQPIVNGTGLRSPWVPKAPHGLWAPRLPSLLPLHFGAFEVVSKMVQPMWSCSRRQRVCSSPGEEFCSHCPDLGSQYGGGYTV